MRKNINETLIQLEEYIPFFKSRNEKISSVGVGWHIEHCLLVIMKISEAVSSSDPDKYKWGFSFKRFIVWLTGRLPRGRAKAPPTVIPDEAQSDASLKTTFERARKSIEIIQACHPKQYFFHPVFGKVKRDDTFDFFAIHTNHHLRIIRDILKND